MVRVEERIWVDDQTRQIASRSRRCRPGSRAAPRATPEVEPLREDVVGAGEGASTSPCSNSMWAKLLAPSPRAAAARPASAPARGRRRRPAAPSRPRPARRRPRPRSGSGDDRLRPARRRSGPVARQERPAPGLPLRPAEPVTNGRLAESSPVKTATTPPARAPHGADRRRSERARTGCARTPHAASPAA